MRKFLIFLTLLIAFTTSEAVAAAAAAVPAAEAEGTSTPAYTIKQFFEQTDILLAAAPPVTNLKIVDAVENFKPDFWIILTRFAPILKTLYLEATSREMDFTSVFLMPFVGLNLTLHGEDIFFSKTDAPISSTFGNVTIKTTKEINLTNMPMLSMSKGSWLTLNPGKVSTTGYDTGKILQRPQDVGIMIVVRS